MTSEQDRKPIQCDIWKMRVDSNAVRSPGSSVHRPRCVRYVRKKELKVRVLVLAEGLPTW